LSLGAPIRSQRASACSGLAMRFEGLEPIEIEVRFSEGLSHLIWLSLSIEELVVVNNGMLEADLLFLIGILHERVLRRHSKLKLFFVFDEKLIQCSESNLII